MRLCSRQAISAVLAAGSAIVLLLLKHVLPVKMTLGLKPLSAGKNDIWSTSESCYC